MIDPKLLTFLKLCETMNYHETARLLNMTQPAVTQHIQALEAEYGCRLFLYDRKRLTATPSADILEMYARGAVFNENRLRTSLGKAAARRLRIGATKSIGEYMINEIAAAYLQDSGHLADITVDNTERLLHLLDENRLDFALVEGSFRKSRYDYRLFRRENLTGICAKDHPLAGRQVPLESLFSETLILREPGSGTREIFTNILLEHGYSGENFARTLMASEFSLLVGLVERNVGISFVYDSVAEHHPSVARFSISEISPSHEMNFVFLPNTVANELIDAFLEPSGNRTSIQLSLR